MCYFKLKLLNLALGIVTDFYNQFNSVSQGSILTQKYYISDQLSWICAACPCTCRRVDIALWNLFVAVFNVWLLLKWFCETVAEILTFLAKYY